MATIANTFTGTDSRIDVLSGTPRAHAIDRWIFVFMAAWFIVITLAGFIPDSMMKIGMVQAGVRPPFPIVLHMHAVLMGSFLLLLFAQTWLPSFDAHYLAQPYWSMYAQYGKGQNIPPSSVFDVKNAQVGTLPKPVLTNTVQFGSVWKSRHATLDEEVRR